MLNISILNFDKLNGLIPCIVQDHITHKVLMLGFMNKEAAEKTVKDKKVTFFSRSKNRLWTKGETSKNFLRVKEIIADCDQDTLLIKVAPDGVACHTGADTCFNEKNNASQIYFLENLINDRKARPVEGSYTNKLLTSGINKIAQKVGEEAVELIIEAKDNHRDLFLNEAADLMYHYLVLLAAKGCKLEDVNEVLKKRHKVK
jgi:phosphoribosyl-AMP cyclohydrolase / phosphoribosyl-ATP pyrophosphohydrolase